MKTIISKICALIALFISVNTQAQYKVETFGKFQKMKGTFDKPIDFKTSFPLKAQVYVQLTYPCIPEFYTINCYKVAEDGTEKLVGTTDIKHFEKIAGKTTSSPQSLGMMYDPGQYRIEALKQSDKSVVATSKFDVTSELATPARTIGIVVFSEDTDDNFDPVKPYKSIKAGESVNFSAKLKEAIGAKFFIWAVFEIRANGDEILYQDKQMNVDNETYRWFATTEKTTFTKAGKYAVYMLYQNGTNSGTTVGKPEKYYARGVLEVK